MNEEPKKPVPALLSLRRLYCNRAIFEQALVPVDFDAPAPAADVEFGVSVALKTREDDPAFLGVQLVLSLEPDEGRNQPYKVEVGYVGEFTLSEALWDLDKDRLAKANCAAILLPYVRQAVGDLTGRGTNGPVLIQPINVAAMFADEPVSE